MRNIYLNVFIKYKIELFSKIYSKQSYNKIKLG